RRRHGALDGALNRARRFAPVEPFPRLHSGAADVGCRHARPSARSKFPYGCSGPPHLLGPVGFGRHGSGYVASSNPLPAGHLVTPKCIPVFRSCRPESKRRPLGAFFAGSRYRGIAGRGLSAAGRRSRRAHLILCSLNSTCLRATGSYFLMANLSVIVRVFFVVT